MLWQVVELGVHIADVTHFVDADSAIDVEGKFRGTSVYLVRKRIDMLISIYLSMYVCISISISIYLSIYIYIYMILIYIYIYYIYTHTHTYGYR